MFRVKTASTAELLTDQLKEINIYDRSTTQGASADLNIEEEKANTTTRFSDGVSVIRTQPLLAPSDIVSLPKGQAFALLEGSKLL